MTFGNALEMLRAGGFVARANWNGKNMWLSMQMPDEHSMMSLPYIYICTTDGDLVPWQPSQSDLLAYDWSEVELGV